MSARRIESGVERGRQFEIDVDGQPVTAFEGETIAAALLAAGRHVFRHTAKLSQPRGLFCGMGICFDCLMTVNGVRDVRACVTLAQPDTKVETQSESGWLRGRA